MFNPNLAFNPSFLAVLPPKRPQQRAEMLKSEGRAYMVLLGIANQQGIVALVHL